MKLKTLKDIQEGLEKEFQAKYTYEDTIVDSETFSEALRAEVIKWVYNMEVTEDCEGHGLWVDGNTFLVDPKEILMKFFNITKEDLEE